MNQKVSPAKKILHSCYCTVSLLLRNAQLLAIRILKGLGENPLVLACFKIFPQMVI